MDFPPHQQTLNNLTDAAKSTSDRIKLLEDVPGTETETAGTERQAGYAYQALGHSQAPAPATQASHPPMPGLYGGSVGYPAHANLHTSGGDTEGGEEDPEYAFAAGISFQCACGSTEHDSCRIGEEQTRITESRRDHTGSGAIAPSPQQTGARQNTGSAGGQRNRPQYQGNAPARRCIACHSEEHFFLNCPKLTDFLEKMERFAVLDPADFENSQKRTRVTPGADEPLNKPGFISSSDVKGQIRAALQGIFSPGPSAFLGAQSVAPQTVPMVPNSVPAVNQAFIPSLPVQNYISQLVNQQLEAHAARVNTAAPVPAYLAQAAAQLMGQPALGPAQVASVPPLPAADPSAQPPAPPPASGPAPGGASGNVLEGQQPGLGGQSTSGIGNAGHSLLNWGGLDTSQFDGFLSGPDVTGQGGVSNVYVRRHSYLREVP
eukprot:2100217-Rhodomonas_salina.2